MTFNVYLIISLILLSLYLFGVGNYLLRHEENACDMTYMYEFPQFIKINVTGASKFDRYNLYAYSEGRLTGKARDMHFDGIPVLFIPGNAGSYKQVRSLASVSLRKYLNSRSRFHFDYFTVDLNEEYSGLFGGVLDSQSQFVNQSINTILCLYNKHYSQPKSLVLIGHSIGGLISQNVLSIDKNSQKVNTIITLATPNKNPIATLDQLIPKFYAETFRYWESNLKNDYPNNKVGSKIYSKENSNNNSLSNILFITIGGGSRDILVPSGLTSSKFGHINTLTTAIPMVWASTDHQCIVWCKQLVLALNRVLFQMVDAKSKQISTNLEERYNTASRLLTISNTPAHSKPVYFRKNAEWYEDNRRLFSVIFKEGLNKTRYQMVRLTDNHLDQMIAVESINLDDGDWIFGCTADQVDIKSQSRMCEKGFSLSNHTRPHPSVSKERRIAYLDLQKIKRHNPSWTHIIFQILPTREAVQLNFDIYNRDRRIIKVDSPIFFSFFEKEALSETLAGSIHYDMIITDFDSLHQALYLNIEPKQCSKKSFHCVATAHVPWAPGHSSVHYFTEMRTQPMSLKLHQSQYQSQSTKNVRIRFVLDPACKYSISLDSSFPDVLGQISRHYSLNLLPYCACILILAVRQQILQLRTDGKCSNLLTAMTTGAKPYYVVTVAKLAQKLSGSDAATPFLLPLLLFTVAWGIIYVMSLVLYAGIAIAGKFAHSVVLRVISFGASGIATKALERLPLAVGVLAIALGSATCGCVSLLIIVVFYSIMLSKMYEDYIDTFVFKTIRKVAKKIIGISSNEEKNDAKKDTVDNSESVLQDNNAENTDNKINKISLNEKFSKQQLSAEQPEQTNDSKSNYNETLPNNSVIKKWLNKAVDVILPGSDITLSEIHFHLTIFLILLFATFLNVPSLLTWSHNFKHSPYLEIDPTFSISMFICVCISVIWQIEAPKSNLLFSSELGYILYALSIGCLIMSKVALYTINYFLASTLILITIHHCMPYFGFKEQIIESNIRSSNTDFESNEDIEDKMLTNKIKVIRTKLQED